MVLHSDILKKCTYLNDLLEEAGGKQSNLEKLYAALFITLNPHF